MGKVPMSVSVDEELKQRADRRPSMNTSAVVNQFLREYLSGGRAPDVALAMEIERMENEIENERAEIERRQAKIDRLEREIDRLETELSGYQDAEREAIESFVERVREGDIPQRNIVADNPAVQNYAVKATMTPEVFVAAVKDELEIDRD